MFATEAPLLGGLPVERFDPALSLTARVTRYTQIMVGQYYDNVMAESFFAALKNERVHLTIYPTRAHARADIARYIEFWSN